MPVPKGVDAKKYDDCVDDVKRKGSAANAYAVCAASLKGKKETKKSHGEGCKCMDGKEDKHKLMKDKLKKSLTEKFVGKTLTDEVKAEIKEDISKALAAGYDSAEAAPETLKEVENGPTLTAPQATEAATSESTSAPAAAAAESSKEPKFRGGLFKEFSLGATLKQTPTGNVMTQLNPPRMDYVKVEKEAIRNVKMSEESLQKLSNKK